MAGLFLVCFTVLLLTTGKYEVMMWTWVAFLLPLFFGNSYRSGWLVAGVGVAAGTIIAALMLSSATDYYNSLFTTDPDTGIVRSMAVIQHVVF
jgi:hypothetical protein